MASLLLAGLAPIAGAGDAPEGLSLRTLEEFRTTGVPHDQWPAVLEALGREDQNTAVQALIRELKPFPAGQLVPLLTHPKLAIRSGALDLLEEAAGDTFQFDPFLEDPASGGNAEALERWNAWSGNPKISAALPPLNVELFRTLAMEIVSGQRDRADRAMIRLDRYGLSAVAQIESFLGSQPELEAGPRAALKVAEYRIVILKYLPKQAGALARDLGAGSVEAQSMALSTLGKAGPGILAVIADFLASSDPLIRETAVDAAFQAGKKHAVGLVAARLATETSESVLHAMLRGLGAFASEPAQGAVIASFVKHPSENVAVSALEALGSKSLGEVTTVLAGALSDPHWRVRAASLEAIAKRKLLVLGPEVQKRLQDEDLFVRSTAVETLRELSEDTYRERLIEEFKKQNDLKAPILRAFLENQNKAPAELFAQLWSAPPEIILQCLEALEDRGDHAGARIVYAAPFASHPNRDVAASALRLLASRGRYTNLLLPALESPDPVISDAVLDVLILAPGTFSLSTSATLEGGAAQDPPQRGSNSLLDRLYKAFSSPPAKAASRPKGAPAAQGYQMPAEQPAPPAPLKAVLERYLREGSPRQRFRAAVVLSGQGNVAASAFILASYDTLNDLDRRMLCGPLAALKDWPVGPTLDLAHRLVRDKSDDVREQAIELWQSHSPLAGLLEELVRPGSLLRPDDLYGYDLDKAAQANRAVIGRWAKELFQNPAALDSHKVLALVLLGRTDQKELASSFLHSPNPWLRRAAYRALGLGAVQTQLAALLGDESAQVRVVLPFLAAPQNRAWQHAFDDAHSVSDVEDLERNAYSPGPEFGAWAKRGNAKAGATPAVMEALEKLARDPSETVRFEAQFALLRLNHPIDPAEFGGLLATRSDDSGAHERVGRFLNQNYTRLARGYGALVPLAKGLDSQELKPILKHFGLEEETAFTSFGALANLAPPVAPNAPNAIAPASSRVDSRSPFRVVFFHKVGCRDCERVREMLSRHGPDFPRMLIEERDIDDPQQALLSEALSERFQLKDTLHLATPAVFTQGGALIREAITFPSLGDLLRKSSGLMPDPSWARVEPREIAQAQTMVTQRYEALNFGVISLAGLLDGINPCAFATLIFLLSYLQVARRTPREILAIGGAFILAVFLTYFAVGFGLAQVLARISGFQVAGRILNQVLAAFALIVAALSFRDARLAARGQVDKMALQLPGVLKNQIRSVIRQGARASHFVLAAFVVGVAISMLELACTGQVYLPTILYMLHSGQEHAVPHLLLYNLAFILPLIVVFGLAWSGMRNEALLRFQAKRTALVKSLTGGLFLLLAAFLLFGRVLH